MRRFLLGIIMCLLAIMAPVSVQAKTVNAKTYSLKDVRKAPQTKGKWEKKSGKTMFRKDAGGYVKSRWLNVQGSIYYLNSKGHRVLSSWVKYRSNMYYVDKTGKLRFGWLINNKYYTKSTGIRAVGWCTIKGERYYFDRKTGIKKTGWTDLKSGCYYLQKSTGKMLKSCWIKTNGKYYYVGADGKMRRSKWLTINGKKYYVDSGGARVTGDYYIGDKGYHFESNGVYNPSVKVKAEVNPNKPMVALTFDDGPGPYTARLLNCLQKYGAKATFFMVGSNVSGYKSTVKRMASLGCELGNHSYTHPDFLGLSVSSIHSQVNNTSSRIRSAAGKNPTVFRLPYGSGASNRTVLNALGLPSIYWSIDTRDWANTGNPQHTVNAVLNYVKSGDIVLMHDIHLSTVRAAEQIIPALKKWGYQMVTVSQLAKYKGKTSLRAGKTYYSFK